MFAFDQLSRVAIATVGALVLSTLSVAAAVAPAQSGEPARTVVASAPHGAYANG
jgi:hypothetical protein